MISNLPCVEPQRIRNFILWILSNQSLPADILSPYSDTMAAIAKHGLGSGLEKTEIRTNSLKVNTPPFRNSIALIQFF